MAIRVVIADDHNLVREGTRNILERSGDITVVGEAADGEEALKMVSDLRPDVALIDIAMPRLNGLETTRRIKAVNPATAVLILTAFDDDAYVFPLLEAGAAGYVLKNILGKELIEAVRSVHSGDLQLAPSVVRKLVQQHVARQDDASPEEPIERLTSREQEVLSHVAKGLTNKEVAKTLALSPRTVQLHLGNIFSKLGVTSRTEAVMVGLKRGLVRMDEVI
jgi:DNA-binding NarL/FixJ family response regulator